MRTPLILLALLLAAAAPAAALPWGACTQAHVNAGACRSTQNSFVVFDFPTAARDEVIAWAKSTSLYQAEVLCGEERRVTDGLLTVAGVTQGDCASGQVGTLVPNPQSGVHVAYAVMRLLLLEQVREWKQRQAEGTALQTVPTATRPDLGSEPPP